MYTINNELSRPKDIQQSFCSKMSEKTKNDRRFKTEKSTKTVIVVLIKCTKITLKSKNVNLIYSKQREKQNHKLYDNSVFRNDR